MRLYVMDESRFGLHSIQRRCLTGRATKPIVPYQHRFENFYLFGAYAPGDGDHFTLELPRCDSDCFQAYLEHFSQHRPEEMKVVVLDNGAFHKSKALQLPDNIVLHFLPPYSPELNPAEQIWRYVKDRVANTVFASLEALAQTVGKIVCQMTPQTIKSITQRELYKKIHTLAV